MRNLLFVLVFISITVLGCGENNSLLEKCADTKLQNYGVSKNIDDKWFFKKSYKEKLQVRGYESYHIECEQERKFAPKTFKVKWQ